ncbi:MAG: FG-GAP-like repeat-containing protein [Myxococcota bacterium]
MMRLLTAGLVTVLVVVGCGPTTSPSSGSRASIVGRVELSTVDGLNDMSRVRVDIGRGEGGTTPSDDGEFEFTDVEADVYELTVTYVGGLSSTASRSAYQRFAQRVVARAGGDVNLGVIRPVLAKGKVSGSVPATDGVDPEGATVELESADGVVNRTVVSGGSFVFEEVPVGHHRARIHKAGYAQASTACSSDVSVDEEDAVAVVTGLSLADTFVGLVPGNGDVVTQEPDLWFSTPSRDSVTAQVVARYPRQGRVWLASEQPGAYQPFLANGYPLSVSSDGRYDFRLQFTDGCAYESPVHGITVIRDGVAPEVLSVRINNGLPYATDDTVGLLVSAVDALSPRLRMRHVVCVGARDAACEAALAAAPYVDFAPDGVLALDGEDGERTLLLDLQDLSGNVSDVSETRFTLDRTPPVVTRFALNGGSSAPTSLRRVGVDISATDNLGDVQIALSESPQDCAAAQYSPLPVGVEFELSGAQGERFLYLCARDGAGNTTASRASDNAVFLDTVAPLAGVLTLAGGAEYVVGAEDVALSVTGGQPGLRLVLEGDLTSLDVPAESVPATLTLNATEGQRTVTAHFVDEAGNRSPPFGDSVILDRTPPVLTVVRLNGGDPFLRTTSASLEVDAREGLSYPLQMRHTACPRARDAACDAELAQAGFVAFETLRTIPLGDQDGLWTVLVQVRDGAGNVSEAGVDTIVFDNDPPNVTRFVINGGEDDVELTAERAVTVAVDATDAISDVEVALSEQAPDCATAAYSLPGVFETGYVLTAAQGARRLYLCARDQAGNATSAIASDNQVHLDSVPPAAGVLTLAAGNPYTRTPQAVDVVITGVPADGSVELSGDITQPGVFAADGIPPSVSVTDGEGLRIVQAIILDAAGNRSPPFQGRITVDVTPPVVEQVRLAEGAPYTTSETVPLTYSVRDALSLEVQARVVPCNGAPDSACAALLAQQPFVDVVLPFGAVFLTDNGEKSVMVEARDQAGNVSAPATDSITLDTQPPRINLFTLSDAQTLTTNNRAVAVHLDIQDDISSVVVALAEGALDCATAQHVYPPVGDFTFVVSDAQGPHALTLCARDEAGKSVTTTSNTITLDTVRPLAGELRIADGRTHVASTVVSVSVDGGEPGADVVLGGDVTAPGTYPLASFPRNFTLNVVSGALATLHAELQDAAGNRSTLSSASITFDDEAPAPGRVVLAGNQQSVNTQTVPVSIEDTLPDTMLFWDATSAGMCTPQACDDNALRPFAPNTTVQLSDGVGTKLVCWQFCDRAGNLVVDSQEIELAPYLSRPVPVLASVTPRSYVVGSSGDTVVATGRGFAADSKIMIGPFVLDCTDTAWATECRADADGGCAATGVCADSCAERCEVTIPGAIKRNSGNFPVRMVTPAPVVGTGESDVQFLVVVAPTPHITDVLPRGIIRQGASQDVTVRVFGERFMDNAEIRIGNITGEVEEIVGEDPVGLRSVRVRFRALDLAPLHDNPYPLTVKNPSPGGGEDATDFGVNPAFHDCGGQTCQSQLRWTRGRLPPVDSTVEADGVRPPLLAQGFEDDWTGGLLALGGERAQVFSREAGGTRSLLSGVRLKPQTSFVPLPWGATAVRVEDGVGSGQRVLLSEKFSTAPLAIPTSRFSGAAAWSPAQDMGPWWPAVQKAVAVTDARGAQGILAWSATRNSVLLTLGSAGPVPQEIEMGNSITGAALADLNNDGLTDLVAAHQGSLNVGVRLGLPNGVEYAPAAFWPSSGIHPLYALQVADMNRDGRPDVVTAHGYGPVVMLGNGDGTLRDGSFNTDVPLPPGGTTALAVADVDGDGNLDIIRAPGVGGGARPGRNVAVYLGDGAGGVTSRAYVEVAGYPMDLEATDLNHDGAPDLVVRTDTYDDGNQGGDVPSVSVVLNQGDGTFGSAISTPVPAGGRSISVTDCTGDGHVDVVSFGAGGATLHQGAGDGTFTDGGTVGGDGPGLVLDVDANGAPEVVAFRDQGSSSQPRSATGVGHGGLRSPLLVAQQNILGRMASWDSFEDGNLDLLAVDPFASRVVIIDDGARGPGEANPTAFPEAYLPPGGQGAVSVADFDLDGLPDALVDRSNDFLIVPGSAAPCEFPVPCQRPVSLYGSPITYSNTVAGGASRAAMVVADFNRDGRPDLVLSEDGRLRRLRHDGVTDPGIDPPRRARFVAEPDVGVGAVIWQLAVADMDRDGFPDVVARLFAPPAPGLARLVFVMGSDGRVVQFPEQDVPQATGGLAVGDVNGDGYLDVVNGSTGWLVNLGLPGAQLAPAFAVPSGLDPNGSSLIAVALRDMNGDGLVELIGSDVFTEKVVAAQAVWGAGWPAVTAESWKRTLQVSANVSPARSASDELLVNDMDGDGVPDVVTSPSYGGRAGASVRYQPSGALQELVLSDMPAMTVVVPPGTTLPLPLGQAQTYVAALSARVRLRAAAPVLGDVELSLVAPDGRSVLLDDGTSMTDRALWQHSYVDIAGLTGWQPEGSWVLEVRNTGSSEVGVEMFELRIMGTHQRPNGSGHRPESAERVDFPPGIATRVLSGSTIMRPDLTDVSCAGSAGGGNHFYEVTLATAQSVTVRAVGTFDSLLELREGTCAANGAVAACNDDAHGVNPEVTAPLAVGTHCIVVDGDGTEGTYDLTVTLAPI